MKASIVSEASKDLVDAKYCLGDKREGWDCLNSLAEFYERCGAKIPRVFDGWDETNYKDRFLLDPDGAREVLEKYLMSLGREISKTGFLPGDLMIFKHQELPAWPGIYLGQGNVLIVMGKKHGVKVFPLNLWIKKLIQVRRLETA